MLGTRWSRMVVRWFRAPVRLGDPFAVPTVEAVNSDHRARVRTGREGIGDADAALRRLEAAITSSSGSTVTTPSHHATTLACGVSPTVVSPLLNMTADPAVSN